MEGGGEENDKFEGRKGIRLHLILAILNDLQIIPCIVPSHNMICNYIFLYSE